MTVFVQHKKNWRQVGRQFYAKRKLTPAEHVGQAQIVLQVAEIQSGPVHGIALDAETGEPLALFRFQVKCSVKPRVKITRVVEFVTDSEGRFSSVQNLIGGRVYLSTHDGGPTPVDTFHDCLVGRAVDDPWRIEFHCAPIVELTLGGVVPADPTSLTAWLLRPKDREPLYTTKVQQRADGTLWIRPHASLRSVEKEEPLILAVGDDGGMLLGLGDYHYQKVDASLHIELESMGRLRVEGSKELSEEASAAGRYGRQGMATSLQPDGPLPAVWAWRKARRKPHQFLPPGRYTVRSWTREHAMLESVVKIRAGVLTTIKQDLALHPGARTVRGVVTTELGQPIQYFKLWITQPGEPLRMWFVDHYAKPIRCAAGIDQRLQTTDAGHKGSFVLERVPPGKLQVWVLGADHMLKVTIVGADDEDQEIRVHEYQLESGFGFAVLDGDKPLDRISYRVSFRPTDGGPQLDTVEHNGRPTVAGNPHSRRFEWAISTSSGGVVFGDQDDFKLVREGLWLAELELGSSWDPRLQVTDASGRPLAGAEVLLDGEAQGTTDWQGFLELHAKKDRWPSRMEVRAEGWQTNYRYGRMSLPRRPWPKVVLSALEPGQD